MADPLVERMQVFGTTIFAEMSALAIATDSINLGQGFPDTDGPSSLLEAAAAAITAGGNNQYPPGIGVPELRRAIADHQRRFYGLEFDADTEVLVTAGATEAIAATLLALVEAGDEVVVFEPYYDSYAACIALAGATRRVVPLHRDGPGWAFDPADLERAITSRTKAILLNTPHNPTGKVFSAAELGVDRLGRAGARPGRHLRRGLRAPDLRRRRICRSRRCPGCATARSRSPVPARRSALPGGRSAGSARQRPLTTAARGVKQFLTYVNGGPFQRPLADALALPDDYYLAAAAGLKAQRDLLVFRSRRSRSRRHRPVRYVLRHRRNRR